MLALPSGNRRCFVFVLLVATASSFVCPSTAPAQILIDDFTEVDDPSPYPVTRNFPSGGGPNEGLLSSTVGDIRSVFLAAGPMLPPPDPFPSDVSLTVDIDTALGQLTSDASADSTTLLILYWVNEQPNPMNVDISGMNELVIDYNSTAEFELTVTLNNLQSGTYTTNGANEGTFALPAAVDGQLRIPLAEINDPVQIQLQPPGTFYPDLDRSSVDLVLLEFGTTTLDATLVLDKLEFVPEPASGVLLLAGGAVLALRRRYRQNR